LTRQISRFPTPRVIIEPPALLAASIDDPNCSHGLAAAGDGCLVPTRADPQGSHLSQDFMARDK
jgi:hypothetical protein